MDLAASRCKWSSQAGFSLIEVMVASLLLALSVVAVAQLFAVSTRANLTSKTTTLATVLAAQKMEQLRALTWGFDRLGAPVSDFATDTAVSPPAATGGTGLRASPADALAVNVDGYVDFVGPFGESLGGGVDPPEGALYTRRWSIAPLPANPDGTLVLQVFVFRVGGRGDDLPADQPVARFPEEARLTTVKTRKAP